MVGKEERSEGYASRGFGGGDRGFGGSDRYGKKINYISEGLSWKKLTLI